jgi:phenylacetic acid degradation operon negative regulatory protein
LILPAPRQVSHAFCRSRFGVYGLHNYGALPNGMDVANILARTNPHQVQRPPLLVVLTLAPPTTIENLAMKPNGKNLILELLMANQNQAISAKEAIAAAALFGMTPNTIRVALARLSAEGLLMGAGRGSYQLGHQAVGLAQDLAKWRQIEQRLRPWHGDYIAVYSAGLGRTDRTALRRRERALEMLGFAELGKGLHIRPNNIESDVGAVRQRLMNLGLESSAYVFQMNQLDPQHDEQLHQLWDGSALNQHYDTIQQQLNEWLTHVDQLDIEVAAREAFLLGRTAIRQVVFDPLLPEPLIDQQGRRAFFECVRQFDRVGRHIWQQVRLVTRITPIADDELNPPSIVLAPTPSVLRRETDNIEDVSC